MSESAQLVREEVEPEEKMMETENKVLQGLPLQSSPYLKYTDMEEYKFKGYGAQGHITPKPGMGGGATDAPTLSRDSRLPGQIAHRGSHPT
ncbi:hypothetical protein ACHQM5_015797 [Ranunculus cassubicifolius]